MLKFSTLTQKTKIIIIVILVLFLIISSCLIYSYCFKQESKTTEKVKTINWNLNPQNETEYQTALQCWQDQCLFKTGKTYTAYKIRELLGCLDRELYTNSDFLQPPKENVKLIYLDNGVYKMKYFYDSGWINDAWYFTTERDC